MPQWWLSIFTLLVTWCRRATPVKFCEVNIAPHPGSVRLESHQTKKHSGDREVGLTGEMKTEWRPWNSLLFRQLYGIIPSNGRNNSFNGRNNDRLISEGSLERLRHVVSVCTGAVILILRSDQILDQTDLSGLKSAFMVWWHTLV